MALFWVLQNSHVDQHLVLKQLVEKFCHRPGNEGPKRRAQSVYCSFLTGLGIQDFEKFPSVGAEGQGALVEETEDSEAVLWRDSLEHISPVRAEALAACGLL